MGDKMRLAVVSSDGENVDLHLGKGKSVYIYDYDDKLDFVEVRDIEIAEDAKHQGGKVIKACEDCDVLIAVQYGFKSKIKAEDAGIKLVMDEGPIDEVLARYIDHVEFMKKSIL
jgi:predicted Fe-Mo cluster-binding NifX family protein